MRQGGDVTTLHFIKVHMSIMPTPKQTAKTPIDPQLDLHPIDAMLSLLLLSHIRKPDIRKVALMIPAVIMVTVVFSWSQHAFFDNELNMKHPLEAVRVVNRDYQLHHRDPGGVCRKEKGNELFAGTRSQSPIFYTGDCDYTPGS